MTREKEILQAYNEQQTKLGNQEHTFMRGAKWADQHPHWISVEEELPKEESWVLAVADDKVATWYYEGENLREIKDVYNITCWMPLPQPPHHFADVSKMVEKGGGV